MRDRVNFMSKKETMPSGGAVSLFVIFFVFNNIRYITMQDAAELIYGVHCNVFIMPKIRH